MRFTFSVNVPFMTIEERYIYFNFDFTNPPIDRTELFKQVLTDDSAENTRVLGKFLKEAFLRHKSEMDIPPSFYPF